MKLFLFTLTFALVTYFGMTMALNCECKGGFDTTKKYCVGGSTFNSNAGICDIGITGGGTGSWNCLGLKRFYNGCMSTFCNCKPNNEAFLINCGRDGLTGKLPVKKDGYDDYLGQGIGNWNGQNSSFI